MTGDKVYDTITVLAEISHGMSLDRVSEAHNIKSDGVRRLEWMVIRDTLL